MCTELKMREFAQKAIQQAQKTDVRMILLQGSVGVGKSTIARELDKDPDVSVVSIDNYFEKDGKYHYQSENLPEAHSYCLSIIRDLLVTTDSIIVVDNCNKNNEDVRQYLDLVDHKAVVIHIKVKDQNEAIKCGKRSTHKVPQSSIIKTFRGIETLAGKGIQYIEINAVL